MVYDVGSDHGMERTPRTNCRALRVSSFAVAMLVLKSCTLQPSLTQVREPKATSELLEDSDFVLTAKITDVQKRGSADTRKHGDVQEILHLVQPGEVLKGTIGHSQVAISTWIKTQPWDVRDAEKSIPSVGEEWLWFAVRGKNGLRSTYDITRTRFMTCGGRSRALANAQLEVRIASAIISTDGGYCTVANYESIMAASAMGSLWQVVGLEAIVRALDLELAGADKSIAGKACLVANVIAPFGHACRSAFPDARPLSDNRRRFLVNPSGWFLEFAPLAARENLSPQETVDRALRLLAFLIEVAPKDEHAELQAAYRRLVRDYAQVGSQREWGGNR